MAEKETHYTDIKGYRTLTQSEVRAVNDIKDLGESILEYLVYLEASTDGGDIVLDGRWLAIAKTDFQTALMAATRAVTRPTNF